MTAPTTLHVTAPADVVTLLPALLGFHPADSLVVVTLDGDPPVLGLLARADLPRGDTAAGRQTIAQLVRALGARGVGAVWLGVVGGSPDDDVFVTEARSALTAAGITVAHAIRAESTAAGAAWHDLDDPGRGGALGDPSATPFAAASALAGLVTFADRAELARLVEPCDAAALTLRAALLDAAVDATGGRGPDADAELAVVLAAVADAARGVVPADDAAVVRLVLALDDGDVRDRCLELCVGEDAAAAERLWLALTRAAPAPEVAGPAALAALCAALRGDGALANVALDRALTARPDHPLATMLADAVCAAVPPDVLRALVLDAIAECRAAECRAAEDGQG